MKHIIISIFILLSFISCNNKKQLEKQETKLAQLTQEVISVKFAIQDRTQEDFTVKLRFYDLDGNEIITEQSPLIVFLDGTELTIDFEVIKLLSTKTFFILPSKIYSEKIPPRAGISLLQYYTINGFPQIFSGTIMNGTQTKQELQNIFNELLEKKQITDDKSKLSFGNAVHEIKEKKFSTFNIGQVYRIVYHPLKGGIEIIEERE